MTDTTAKIRAKRLDATGVTEEIANQMYAHKGKHYMGIVEFKVEERHEKADGTKKVDLVLTQVEPAVEGDLAEHLRELTRTLHQNRTSAGAQRAIDDELDDEPTVEGVVAAGGKFRPHPFLPVDAADDNGICDVCGLIENVGVHEQWTDDSQDEAADDEAGTEDALQDTEPDEDGSAAPPEGASYDDPFAVGAVSG